MAVTARAWLLALVGLVPVLAAPQFLTVAGWLVLVLLMIFLDVALAGPCGKLSVERGQIPTVRLGESVTAQTVLTNHGPRPVRGLVRDAWQPSARADSAGVPVNLPPSGSCRLRTRLSPSRRGDLRAQCLTVRSLGPLGIAARQQNLPVPGTVRVLPPFASRKHLPSRLARLRELDGRTSLMVRGAGTEFDSLRDYVIGDDVRSIDWRATARGRQVVVRTWRPERDRRVLLVLDTSRTSAARVGDAPRLDASLDAALLLAALASRAGDRVDLLAVDRRIRARVEGVAGPRLLPSLVDAMATLEPDLVETDWPQVVTAVRSRLTRRSLVVLFTSLDASALEEGLLPVVHRLTSHHQVLVASVSDPQIARMAVGRGDARAVYAAACAERSRLERSAVTAEIVRAGVEVVDALPEELPPRLADRYLALKAAGKL
ncbi:MAG: hypothetical protein QG608_3266 [Actinomycetota bacterium]|nr:hypothetical protein [Actinomycetota bacterium]